MGLPAEIDDEFEAALSTKPVALRSYFALDANNDLPKIPMASQQVYQGQMRNLMYHYMTTPGIGECELSQEEQNQLTPFEIGLWNFCKRFRDETTDFTERKWLAEMVMGPVINRNENINLNVVKDWRKDLSEKATEVADTMAFAHALEADIVDMEIKENGA